MKEMHADLKTAGTVRFRWINFEWRNSIRKCDIESVIAIETRR